MQIKKQKANTDWIDESGKVLPYTAIKNVEKVNETVTYDIAIAASKVSQQLYQFKLKVSALVDKALTAFHKQYKGKKTEFKGNYTIKNFDESIKVEVKVSNPIKFDDLTIMKARDLLKEFLNDGISSKDETIKEMVLDAFETSRGKMDVQKVLGLKKYGDRIKDSRWKKAMALIDSAIRKPSSAIYYRVWVKDEQGKYQAIPLALADV